MQGVLLHCLAYADSHTLVTWMCNTSLATMNVPLTALHKLIYAADLQMTGMAKA